MSKGKMRNGFYSLELMLTLAVVLVLTSLASVKAIESQKENALEKLYLDTTQLLNFVVGTDNINSYVGYLRSGTNCLDSSTYDTTGTRVNFDTMKSCLGDDMGVYKNNIVDTLANSYYLYNVLPCTLKIKGSSVNNNDFTMTLDCTQIEDDEYRTSVLMRMSDYAQSRDMWMNLYSSSSIDADGKILTVNLRL